MTELAECYVLSPIYVTGIRINFRLFLLLATNTKCAVYIVNAEAEVNKYLNKSLIMLPVIILNIIFCILKIFTLCEESHLYINPQFIKE